MLHKRSRRQGPGLVFGSARRDGGREAPPCNIKELDTRGTTEFLVWGTATNWLGDRFNSLTDQLASVRPLFHLLTNSASVTNQATYDLGGYAPVEAVFIRTNGSVLPVTWLNQTQWVGTVGLSMGTNNFTVDGTDRWTNSLPPIGSEDYTDTAVIIRY